MRTINQQHTSQHTYILNSYTQTQLTPLPQECAGQFCAQFVSRIHDDGVCIDSDWWASAVGLPISGGRQCDAPEWKITTLE